MPQKSLFKNVTPWRLYETDKKKNNNTKTNIKRKCDKSKCNHEVLISIVEKKISE